MTTINPTFDHYSEHRTDTDNRRRRTTRRRRTSQRAFALGATIATLCVGGAWAAVETFHSHGPAGSSGSAASVIPATADGGSAASTTGSSTGTTSGSHTGTPANTYPHGQNVANLQRDLGQLNYYENTVDGVYGPATIAAIKDFQRANGLAVDGIAGPSTMAKIKEQMITGDNQMGPSGPPVKPSDNASKPANSNTGDTHGTNASGGATPSASSSSPTPAG